MPESGETRAARVGAAAPMGMITVRGNLASKSLSAAIRDATGLEIPGTRAINSAAEASVAWMSPDELLLFVERSAVEATLAELDARLKGEHMLFADVSDARVAFRVSGPSAREVLAKGTPVDLAAGAFDPGMFCRTRLGQVPVAFWMSGDEEVTLLCFRSVGRFVHDWLTTAAESGSFPRYL